MNEYALEVHDLVYSFDNRLLFDCVNFNVKKNSITSIVGSNGSGKTSLIKILGASYQTENMVKVGNIQLNSYTLSSYQKRVVSIDFTSFKFNENNIYDELFHILDFTNWEQSKKDRMIEDVLNDFALSKYKDRHPSRLSKRNKINLLFARAFVLKPKILIMELSDIFLNTEEKNYIFSIIKKYRKNMTFIYSTNNKEDIMYSDRMLVLHKGKVAMEGATMSVLKQDRLLLKIGIELPFMIDLSIKLKFYEVIDHIYLKEEDLVNQLWK